MANFDVDLDEFIVGRDGGVDVVARECVRAMLPEPGSIILVGGRRCRVEESRLESTSVEPDGVWRANLALRVTPLDDEITVTIMLPVPTTGEVE